ncbi:hypothetical protein ONZ51_g5834 [Trametes cubensis]|uniref:ATP-dependent DNA helicase n=1 Tax=Trametes cubensis TaxID=1111947 RepID=A0AAD7XB45_9APHY|nr:hypothetical protein ONZ51_g5834 [Trametes cubensis]
MDGLFGDGTEHIETGVPCSIEIGHISYNDAVSAATANYVPNQDQGPSESDDDLMMDTVGYTDNDDSPVSERDMMMKALSHCLGGHRFVQSQAGSRFIPDFENEELLTLLFPHLDPWNIGGFHDKRRGRRLSLEQQLKYLLSVDCSPFRDDPDFAFIFYNIRQKKAVLDSVTFRVSASQRDNVIRQLMQVNVSKLNVLIEKFKQNPRYKPHTEDESALMRLLTRVNAVSPSLPGSNGYKIRLRNQIRGLINYLGTPTFFITLNPSDRDHPLVEWYAGHAIDPEGRMRGVELSRWKRTCFAARNPTACAQFFDKMISSFINVILRFERPGRGLFGKCKAYYGTVEAQGRGALHCHMLIWLEGHSSPQVLRDKLAESDAYRVRMFEWLESLIKCELPGTVSVVKEPEDEPLPKPLRPRNSAHPGAVETPSPSSFSRSDEFEMVYEASVTELVQEFNWHEHNATCFKYVPNGTVPTSTAHRNALCRMRIDGSTCAQTHLDEESGAVILRRLHPRIASYNDLVVYLMRCNMDIKFIGSGEAAKALLYYITDYITKPSLPIHVGLGALSYAIQRTNEKFPQIKETVGVGSSRGALTLTVNRMISRQELSQQQVMSYLVGGGDVYSSHTFRVLHWGSFDRLFKKLVEMDGMDSDNDPAHRGDDMSANANRGDTDADMQDAQDTDETEDAVVLTLEPGTISSMSQQQDYMFRSTDPIFEELCLYEFVGLVEKIRRSDRHSLSAYNPEATGDVVPEETLEHARSSRRRGRVPEPRGLFSSHLHRQQDTHMLRKRTCWTIPVILGNRTPRSDREDDEREAWARMMSILFVPWRGLSDLRRNSETWTSAFERHRSTLTPRKLEVISNMNVLSECRDARDSFHDMRRAEALAVLRDGLPADIRAHHTGIDDDLNCQEFQLFDKPGYADAYENVHELSMSQGALDDKVGAKTRELLDRCYGNLTKPVEGMPRSAYSNGDGASDTNEYCSRVREEDDESSLQRQKAVMNLLKRQRRPEFNNEVANTRPRKKRRQLTVVENIAAATLDEGAQANRPDSRSLSSDSDVEQLIEDIVRDMNLHSNPEQERAFRIIAEHVRGGKEQLLMYVAGVGGTGKTHVVRAILSLFAQLNRSREILVGAPTGAAALNIDGYTVHSLLMFPRKGNSAMEALRKLWGPVNYLIIDEISMIGAKFLSEISKRLQHAKSDDGYFSVLPFGGVNVIFTGDFGQLKPVQASPLYSYKTISCPGIDIVRNSTGIEKMEGVYLWRQVRTMVKLIQNQRQSSDPEYADLLGRVRIGEVRSCRDPSTGKKSDVDILFGRVMQQAVLDDPFVLEEFGDAPIIVASLAGPDQQKTSRR